MKAAEPYARLYFDKFIREFPEVYADDALLATWVRLLVLGEKMWPHVPELPRAAKPRAVAELVRVGLVELVQPHSYRIRGLDAERTRRSNAARNAAAQRWQSAGSADGNAEVMPSTSTRRDETKIPPPPAERGRRKSATNPRATGHAPRQNGTAPRDLGESPRQERERQKRGGMPEGIGAILARAAAEGRR